MSGKRIHMFSQAKFQSVAPFSHAVNAGNLGHVSGIIGQRREDGTILASDVGAQAQMMFDNLKLVLGGIGYDLANLDSTRVYLVDYAAFDAVNKAYRQWLTPPYRARTTLQVTGLPLGVKDQIDAIFDASKRPATRSIGASVSPPALSSHAEPRLGTATW